MSNVTVTNERPYYRIEWALGLLAAGLSMVMIAWAAKDTWFFADVWDHLANRSLGSINDILRPRGAHWVTPTVVLMRSTYALFGLDYWPWHYILRLVVWAGMAIVIWRVLLVRGTDRLVAMAALLILLFLGPSSWVVSAFLGNPLALGAAVVAAAIAASRPVAIRRARILLFAALLLALISSGEGVALLVAIGIAIVVAARFKDWWPSLVGAAGIYGVWFIYYSRNGDMGTSQAGGAISHQLPVKIAETLAANLPGILGLTADFGPVLLVALVVLVSALAVQRKLGIYEGTLLGTMVLYVALIYVGRVGTGLAIPNADRYMSTIGVLLIAALVPHIGRITTRQRRATFVAISLAILVTQGPILLRGINFWEAWSSASRDVVESAGAIVVDGEPYLDNALVDPPKSGVLRFRDLAGFIDDGWDPRLSDDANVVELARAAFSHHAWGRWDPLRQETEHRQSRLG